MTDTYYTGNLTPNSSGGGAAITIDSELSNSSENPVQNKVVTGALSGKMDSSNFIPAGTVITIPTDYATLSEAIASLDGKYSNGTVTIQYVQDTYTKTEKETIDAGLYDFNIPHIIIDGNGSIFNSDVSPMGFSNFKCIVTIKNMTFNCTDTSSTAVAGITLSNFYSRAFLTNCTFTDFFNNNGQIYTSMCNLLIIDGCEFNHTNTNHTEVNKPFIKSTTCNNLRVRNCIFSNTNTSKGMVGILTQQASITKANDTNTFTLGNSGTCFTLETGGVCQIGGTITTSNTMFSSNNSSNQTGFIKGN